MNGIDAHTSSSKSGRIDIKQTRQLAQTLAEKVQPGDVLALSGEVGAGKTTFAQAFIGALLAAPEPITSPTFNLVQDYRTKYPWRVVHADLYRLKHPGELAELGLEEAFESQVTLIEWPEIAGQLLPPHTLYVHLGHAAGESRTITLSSASPRWREIAL